MTIATDTNMIVMTLSFKTYTQSAQRSAHYLRQILSFCPSCITAQRDWFSCNPPEALSATAVVAKKRRVKSAIKRVISGRDMLAGSYHLGSVIPEIESANSFCRVEDDSYQFSRFFSSKLHTHSRRRS